MSYAISPLEHHYDLQQLTCNTLFYQVAKAAAAGTLFHDTPVAEYTH